jgi:NAD(P)-dependent dehydrogenase (short-subunit alcohol dehydrogenase family)
VSAATASSVSFDEAWVIRFAQASGDVNPLHVDADYARRTPHGRPVVHGVLGVIAALARLHPHWLAGPAEMNVRFRQPIFPDTRYGVRVEEDEACAARVVLHLGGMEMLSVTITPRAPGTGSHAMPEDRAGNGIPGNDAGPPTAVPRILTHDDMTRLGAEAGVYRPDREALRHLCDELGGAAIPGALRDTLAWSSYWTGMRTPGRDALLAGLRLRVCPGECVAADALPYAAAPPRFDRRTGSCVLEARLDCPAAAVGITIDSILRRPVPRVTSRSLEQHLEPTRRLSGRRVLVVGGTRGLGRGITLALAQQGAEVPVVHRAHSRECLEEMREDLGSSGDRLVSLCCDAADVEALAEALRGMPSLDGLVLPPTPAIPSLPFGTDAMAQSLVYVQQSLQLAWAPLAACAEGLLRDGATIVMLSSAAVEDAPALWPHYVVAKMALEGLARYCAGRKRWQVTIARPPRLWTELTNAATGHIGTVSTECVATRIVERIVADLCGERDSPAGEVDVLTAAQLGMPVENRSKEGACRAEQ